MSNSTSTTKNKNHVYDYIVIGAGLTGLTIAAALSKKTKNVLLLEGADHSGGSNRPIAFPTGDINNGLRLIPNTESSQQALLFLENILNLKLIKGELQAPVLTYENSQLKSFLGFKDEAPDFYEELAYFIHASRLQLNIEPRQWPQLLLEKFEGEFSSRSYVTKFITEGEQVTGVMVNGTKTIHAQNFIFCGTVKDLAILVPEDSLGAKHKHKLSKGRYWSAINLDLCHNHSVTDSESVHLLNGTTQDDIGPCAGLFLPAVEKDGSAFQTSQWVTFIDTESSEESELIANALKKVKRQIKRAYPEAIENLVTERIFISPIIGGHGELKLSGDQSLPKLKNLWIGSPVMNLQKNLVGSLQQSQMILTALGFDDFSVSNEELSSDFVTNQNLESSL